MPLAEGDTMTVQADPQDHGRGKFETSGQRASSQLCQEFFLPLSQREKRAKHVLEVEDEPRPPASSTAVDHVVKKKKGRRRKSNYMDDEDRGDFMFSSIEERSKKSGLKNNDGTLNREAASAASEDGVEKDGRSSTKLLGGSSEFFRPASQKGRPKLERSKDEAPPEGAKKRGRPRTNALDLDSAPPKISSPSGVAKETGKKETGKPLAMDEDCRSCTRLLIDRSKLDRNESREWVTKEVEGNSTPQAFAFLANPDFGPPQVLLDGQPAFTNEGQVKLEGRDPPIEGTTVEHSDIRKQGKNSLDNDFFMPRSRRLKRKSEVQEDLRNKTRNSPAKSTVQKTEQGEQHALPRTRSKVGKAKISPAKPAAISSKEIHSALPGSAAQPIDHDLRSEALLATRETARLNAGKMTHPFFAKREVSKWTSVARETGIAETEYIQRGAPIHVTQYSEDEKTELTWQFGPFVVNQGSPMDEILRMEESGFRLMPHLRFPSSFEHDRRPDLNARSANSLEVGAQSAAQSLCKSSYMGNDISTSLTALHHFLKSMQTPAPASTVMEENPQTNDVSQRSKTDYSIETLRSRLSWYTARHDSQTSGDIAATSRVSKELDQGSTTTSRNILWTDLYQPRSSREVYGNATPLACLRGWLSNWQQTIPEKPTTAEVANDNTRVDTKISYDSDKGWFEGDSDSDADHLESDNAVLDNTLLITGPEGCGKSVGVYACAAELGLSVIEVNASNWRSGALIKNSIGLAINSHGLRGVRPVGDDPPLPANGKHVKELAQIPAPTPPKQRAAKENAAAGKSIGGRLSLEVHQERPLLMSQNEASAHRFGNPLILFEDVDRHFEEDKGFLPTLVQLSKSTKRPIILTCNRREPRLSPVLEKFRIDFQHPTLEELIVHNFLVCMAEGVTCSPQIVESLVNSCKFDPRKVMMALQFWGQGGGSEEESSESSRSTEFLNDLNGLELPDRSSHCISNKLSLSRKKLHSLPQSFKVPVGREYGNRVLDPWQVHGRWLFELDVHHLILPKVWTGNSVCPLSLSVAEAIREAVGNLDEYAAQAAASKLEEGARALQSKREAAALARKAEKKEEIATRKLFEFCTRAEQKRDRNERLHTPDEDDVMENLCCETCVDTPTRIVDTPTKSLREAKNLARSPLAKKQMTSRRALLLHDSDDDEQVFGRLGMDTKDGDKSTSDVGPALSNSKAKRALLLSDSDDEHNVSTQDGRNIVDGNKTTSSCNAGHSLPELRPRRTLQLCDSSDGEQDPPTANKIDIASNSQDTLITTSTSYSIQPAVALCQEKAAHVVAEDLSDADVIFRRINSSEIAEKVTLEIPGERNSRPNGHTPSEGLTSSGILNIDIGTSEEKLDRTAAKRGFQLRWRLVGCKPTQETLADAIDVVLAPVDQRDRPIAAEANPSGDLTLQSLEDGKEQEVQRFYDGRDSRGESSLPNRREACIDASTNPLALSPVDARVSSDVSDVVPESDSLPGLPCREGVLNSSLENDATLQPRDAPTETQPDHMESVRGVLEYAESVVNSSTDNAGVDGTRSLEAGTQGESAPGEFDPVRDAWMRLRSSREEYRSMMNVDEVVASLADIVDVISTSDVMARLQSRDDEDSGRGFEGTVCKACEGNGGQCNHWDSCEEAACQFVRTGLQFSAASSPSVKDCDERLPILECILEGGRDPSAIGKCLVAYASLTNKLEGGKDIGARFNSSSHADREARLKDVIYAAVLPKGRVSSTAFVEYSAYLSRMSHLEEVRRTHTVGEERRRPRRFDHRLISQSFSDSGIAELLKLSKYGNA